MFDHPPDSRNQVGLPTCHYAVSRCKIIGAILIENVVVKVLFFGLLVEHGKQYGFDFIDRSVELAHSCRRQEALNVVSEAYIAQV